MYYVINHKLPILENKPIQSLSDLRLWEILAMHTRKFNRKNRCLNSTGTLADDGSAK